MSMTSSKGRHSRGLSSGLHRGGVSNEGRFHLETNGLPIKNGGSFHGYVSHNQMVISFDHHISPHLEVVSE